MGIWIDRVSKAPVARTTGYDKIFIEIKYVLELFCWLFLILTTTKNKKVKNIFLIRIKRTRAKHEISLSIWKIETTFWLI